MPAESVAKFSSNYQPETFPASDLGPSEWGIVMEWPYSGQSPVAVIGGCGREAYYSDTKNPLGRYTGNATDIIVRRPMKGEKLIIEWE